MLGAPGTCRNGNHGMLTRALIVLLIVLNLGVAAWWTLRPAPRAPAPDAVFAGVPRLQLASERKSPVPVAPPLPTPASVAATPPVEVATQDTALQCFRFGPYADAASADAAAAKLRTSVRKATSRTIASGGKGWTVWLPPFADRAAAQAMAQKIVAAGEKDYYVVANGAQANAVMLGRYGSEASARRRLEELRGKGIEAQVQAPPDAVAQSWVDVATAPGFEPAAAQARIGSAGVSAMDCAQLR